MKTYGYLPIVQEKDVPELTPHKERHDKRKMEALTELIARLALIQNNDIRKALTDYEACLIEKEDGSRTIGVSFPEKRFS